MDRRSSLTRTGAPAGAALASAAVWPRADDPEAPPAPGDIVLGMSAAFRGPSRGLGIEMYRGSTAYLEHVIRSAGVLGRVVPIKPYNDGYSPRAAIANAVRLIEQDGVLL